MCAKTTEPILPHGAARRSGTDRSVRADAPEPGSEATLGARAPPAEAEGTAQSGARLSLEVGELLQMPGESGPAQHSEGGQGVEVPGPGFLLGLCSLFS